jgi:hypothetical protein
MKYQVTKAWLEDTYLNQGLSMVDISKLIGCAGMNPVKRMLIKFEIPLRGRSEAVKIAKRAPRATLKEAPVKVAIAKPAKPVKPLPIAIPAPVIEQVDKSVLIHLIVSLLDTHGVAYSIDDEIIVHGVSMAIDIAALNSPPSNLYREQKRLRYNANGMRLITLYEDDLVARWPIVERLVLNAIGECKDAVVFARKCTIDYSPDVAETKSFFNQWHIQGSAMQNKTIALRHGNEMVAAMAFKGNVLTRYTTSKKVVGGFSRLLKNCGLQEDIISFVDLDTFAGGAYGKAGFVVDGYLKPDYKYIYGGVREHKFNFRLKRFRNDASLFYDPGFSEKELAVLNAIPRIYNSGMLRLKKTPLV